jgi:hypothetical protein
MAQNWDSIKISASFSAINPECLIEIIKHDDLKTPMESALFVDIRQWAENQSKKTNQPLRSILTQKINEKRIIDQIRLEYFSPSELEPVFSSIHPIRIDMEKMPPLRLPRPGFNYKQIDQRKGEIAWRFKKQDLLTLESTSWSPPFFHESEKLQMQLRPDGRNGENIIITCISANNRCVDFDLSHEKDYKGSH